MYEFIIIIIIIIIIIFKYERNKDWLNAWKQSLIQRMNVNNNHYFSHQVKIVYVKSRLIIDNVRDLPRAGQIGVSFN